MMRQYNTTVCLAMAACILTSCNVISESGHNHKANEKGNPVTGALEFVNDATESEWINIRLRMGDLSEELGIASKSSKTTGFARIKLDNPLEMNWEERYVRGEEKEYRRNLVKFSTMGLADIAHKVKGMQFTYRGRGEWKLRLFSDMSFEERNFLGEIEGQDVGEDNPSHPRTRTGTETGSPSQK